MCSARVEHGRPFKRLCNRNTPTLQLRKKTQNKTWLQAIPGRCGSDRRGVSLWRCRAGAVVWAQKGETDDGAASRLEGGDRANPLRNADLSLPSGRPRAPVKSLEPTLK